MFNNRTKYQPRSPFVPLEEQIDYNLIMDRRQTNLYISPATISSAISKEVKFNRNYRYGEELFIFLEDNLEEKRESRPDYQFAENEIGAFQKAMATLIRYAPNISKARYYFCLTLEKYVSPFRSARLEVILLTNLIYVSTTNQQAENMKDALELIQTALDMGVLQVEFPKEEDASLSNHFGDTLEVFETVARKVLKYYRLEFNSDKTGVQPSTRQFSH